MLRTRGMPTRSLLRAGDDSGFGPAPAERVLPNHVGNVRILTLDLLELRLHHAHLVGVFHQPLGAGIAADDALPPGGQRHLAPGPPLRPGELDVDEGARAVDRAPLADGLGLGRARVGQRLAGVEAAELARRPALPERSRAEGGPDGPRLARVRLQDPAGAGHLLADEVHL